MNNCIKVFYASYPNYLCDTSNFFEQKKLAIEDLSDKKKIMQSAWAWALLLKKLSENGISIEPSIFSRTASGKYLHEDVYISISHSEDLVAISFGNIMHGVDIELIRNIGNRDLIADRILTESEKTLYKNSKNSNLCFLKYWSKKESIYKMLDNKKNFCNINVRDYNNLQKSIIKNGKKYLLTVSSDALSDILIFRCNLS